jgi:chemotaxis protein methyltransferase CheR
MAFTFFFRDAEVLETAVRRALPDLCGQAFIHIWDAGCAHGPEPYTLAMILHQQMSEFVFHNVRIHATDVDVTFERAVRNGIYRDEELRRIPGHLRDRYFAPHGTAGHHRVIDDLRARVHFARHDLLSFEPVREGLAMVVCKNVLLHFDALQREKILRMFHGSLRAGGLLVMESTQKLPAELLGGFAQVYPQVQIFRKLDVPVAPRTSRTGLAGIRVDAESYVRTQTHSPDRHVSYKKEAEKC